MLKSLRLGILAFLLTMISLLLSTQVAKIIPEKPPANVTREITLEKRYLNLPVKNGGPKRQMRNGIGANAWMDSAMTRAHEVWMAFLGQVLMQRWQPSQCQPQRGRLAASRIARAGHPRAQIPQALQSESAT